MANIKPDLTGLINHFDRDVRLDSETQVSSLLIVDVFGSDFNNGIRLVVVVIQSVTVNVDKTGHFFKGAFLYFNLGIKSIPPPR